MSDNNHNNLERIRDRLINLTIMVMFFSFLPNNYISIVRAREIGINVQTIALPISLLILAVTYLLKDRLSVMIKVLYTIFALTIISISGFITFGLMSMAVSISLVSVFLSALFFKSKMRYANAALAVLIFLIFALLVNQGAINFRYDANQLNYSLTFWIAQFIGFVTLIFIIQFTISYMIEQINTNVVEAKQNEAKYKTLIDSMDDIIYSIDPNGILLSANKNFCHLLEVDAPNVIGKHYSAAVQFGPSKDELFKTFLSDVIHKALADKSKHHFQKDISLKNLRHILDISITPLFGDKHEIIMILFTHRDITELVKTKEAIELLLKNENERLEFMLDERTRDLEKTMTELIKSEKLASLGSLVAGVAHEINTPLGVAISADSYLQSINSRAYQKLVEGNFSKQVMVDYMKSIDETSDILSENLSRAAELVKSFKEISVNQSHDYASAFNLTEFIQSIIITLKHEYKNTPHTIHLNAESNVYIHSYPSAYSQIITNLIMNSLKHAFNDDCEGKIDIEITPKTSDLEITFKDNGDGISPDHIEKIYDPFFTTKRGQGGSGLGLSIVFNIVTEKLKGNITCESHPNQGTTFVLSIPNVIVDTYEQKNN